MGKGQALYKEAKKIIPGGTQLLSKRPEMFLPDQWPAYYKSAKGCTIVDLDGKHYIDVSYMGIGACALGYANDEVDTAAKNAIDNGGMCTLNAPEEVELAKKLIELHPWAEMVRYARTGGEALAVAVRIARAYTCKDIVLVCGYHGWHDWYIATNLKNKSELNPHHLQNLYPTGVPNSLAGTTVPFLFNNIEDFYRVVKELDGRIAAIVMEPVRNEYPSGDFIKTVHVYAKKNNIVFIFDEVTAGFRIACGGSHRDDRIAVEPDVAVFGKSIANGFPMAAIIGNKSVMSAAEDSFISSSFFTERIGPAAALKSIEIFERPDTIPYLNYVGGKVRKVWDEASKKYNVAIHATGILPLSHFSFLEEPLLTKTYFNQCMLERGYIASTALYASIAHTDRILEQYAKDFDETFADIARHRKKGNLKEVINGPICHSGFQRLN